MYFCELKIRFFYCSLKPTTVPIEPLTGKITVTAGYSNMTICFCITDCKLVLVFFVTNILSHLDVLVIRLFERHVEQSLKLSSEFFICMFA